MTKKNAKKTAARARQKALGGKYLSHLRILDGGDGGGGGGSPQRFFDQVTNVVRAVYPDAKFEVIDEINRLEIGIGSHRFAALTPINAEPKWPLWLRNMTSG